MAPGEFVAECACAKKKGKMNHRKRSTGWLRGIVLLSMLLGVLLSTGAVSGQSPRTTDPPSGQTESPAGLTENPSGAPESPSDAWYYAGSAQVSLPLATDQVAVRFAAGLTAEDQQALVTETEGLAPLEKATVVPVPELTLLQLQAGLGQDQVLQLLKTLRADPRVAFAYPVFALPDARMTLTDQFVAQFKADAATEAVTAFQVANGVEVVAEMRLPNTYLLRVGAGGDSLAMANLYNESDLTTFASPDFVRFLTPQWAPSDTYYPHQWGMENLGTNPPDGVGTADADMDASAAWDISLGDPQIVIAIIDEGVQMTHEDLNAKVVAQYTAIPGDVDANPNNTWDAHGTNCAGIATAETNNAQGVAGVCPNCSLMAVQIAYSLFDGGNWVTEDAWIADAITWAVDNGADVLSNSWGGGSPSALIDAAIAHAVNDGRGGLGSVVLFAAGNGNATPVIYPASNNSTLAMGATSPCDERKNPASCDGENWWGSNYGADLDLVAPGVEWWSTDMMGAAGYGPDNYFDHMNGTSSATPAAAGVAGLILSYKPCLPQSRVQQIMMHSADDQVGPPGEDLPGWDQYMGWGRINAHQALLQANEVQCGPVPCGPHVYFDVFHDAGDTVGRFTALADLIINELNGTFREESQPLSLAALAGSNVLVIADPENALASAEIAAIAGFVQRGGRLVILGEWYGAVDEGTLNDLLNGVGVNIDLNSDIVYDPTDNESGVAQWPRIHSFAPHPLAAGVGWSATYAGASLSVAAPAVAVASGDGDTYTGTAAVEGLLDNAGTGLAGLAPQRVYPGAPVVMAYSTAGPGSVFVTGDSGLWESADPDGDGILSLDEYDNRQLARNVFGYPWCRMCLNILFDETHGYAGNFSIGNAYSELAAFLTGNGHIVQALRDPAPFDFATLSRYDVLVLVLPQEFYTPAEKVAISRFVSQGGRLVTISEWGGYAGVSRDILNDVHTYLGDGLVHNYDSVYDPTTYEVYDFWPLIHVFAPDPVNSGVDTIVEYAGSSLRAFGPAHGTAFGDDDTYTMASGTAVQGSDAAPDRPLPPDQADGWLELLYNDRPSTGETNAPPGDTAPLGSSYIYHGVQAGIQNILIYADDPYHPAPNTFLDQALQALGLGYTAHYNGDWAGFEASLTGGGPWDLVLFGNDNYVPPESTWTALNNYVLGGGRLVFNSWRIFANPSHPLWATLGFTWVQDDTDPPAPVHWWVPGHRIFTRPESVPEFTVLQPGRYGVYGQYVEPLPGFEALAGYTTPGPDPNQAAMIVGNGGRTVFKGFLDGQNDANRDGDGRLDGVELWINLIEHMHGPVIVQARANVGAGDVYAIGDGNLWDKFDPDGDSIISLFEHDNARLAHNVFAFGYVCDKCRVALFKDKNPWGPGLLTGLASESLSTGPTPPPYDDALLDAAGNLPAEAEAVPIEPLALGDVVHSFPAPVSGFLGLEWINGYLWAAAENTHTLYRLHPATGAILETIPVPGVSMCGLAWDGSSFWIPDCSASTIVQVDPSGTVLRSFPSPTLRPVGLAWDGAYLWDVDWTTDQVHQIDPFTGVAVLTFPAPDTRAAGVAWDGQALWVNGRDSDRTYKLDPVTGAVLAFFNTPPGGGSNAGTGAAFDGQYLWTANYDVQALFQIDVEHVLPWLDPNEQVLRAWNIPYDIFRSAHVGAVDLAPYCKVIVASDQLLAFYQTLSANRAWLEGWIARGGMFEFHGAAYTDTWNGLPMPGGFTAVYDARNDVTILDRAHPVVDRPNTITDAEVDGWNFSTHGFLIDLPRNANHIIAHEPTGQPATAEFRFGAGCVLATKQTLEWAWSHGYSHILENFILHPQCEPVGIYLPLSLRNWP